MQRHKREFWDLVYLKKKFFLLFPIWQFDWVYSLRLKIIFFRTLKALSPYYPVSSVAKQSRVILIHNSLYATCFLSLDPYIQCSEISWFCTLVWVYFHTLCKTPGGPFHSYSTYPSVQRSFLESFCFLVQHIFNRLHFQSSFKFTSKLNRKYRDSLIPLPSAHK